MQLFSAIRFHALAALSAVLLSIAPLAALAQDRPAKALAPPRFEPTPENIALRDDFIRGNVNFTLLHEIGHLLVWAYDLPVLGREEDAADQFATNHLTRLALSDAVDAPNQAELALGPPQFHQLIKRLHRLQDTRDITRKLALSLVNVEGPATYFSIMGAVRPNGLGAVNWWDEHGVDEQRAARVKCLSYGALFQRLPGLAEVWAIPEDMRQRCVRDAAASKQGLDKLLGPWFAQADYLNETLPPDSPFVIPGASKRPSGFGPKAMSVDVHIDERVRGRRESEFFRTLVTPRVMQLVLSKYKPSPKMEPGPIAVYIKECGASNAYFSPANQSITLCTELIASYWAAGEAIVAHWASAQK